jgi:hypothetical protein
MGTRPFPFLIFRAARPAAVLAVLACCALLPAGLARGGPQNGIGVYGGAVGHAFVQPLVGGGERDFTSAGPSLAADAQFVWTERWSINPAVLVSPERITGGNIEGELVSYASILQLRHWLGNGYLGAQIGIYKQVIRTPRRTFDTGDAGFGFAAGWEGERGLLFNVQYDWERALTGERIQALRAQLGYRWR